MRERDNAGMQQPDRRGAHAKLALAPMALAAVVVVLVAVLVAGGQDGTIVVQRVLTGLAPSVGAKVRWARAPATSIIETSRQGAVLGLLVSSSSAGGTTVVAGDRLEFYDPSDNTIYETTETALRRTTGLQELPYGLGVGTFGDSGKSVLRPAPSFIPGQASIYQQELEAGLARTGPTVRLDGRTVLELLPVRRPAAPVPLRNLIELRTSVYVTPQSYDPVEQVLTTGPYRNQRSFYERWLTYRVLPATTANLRLLSLRALHPHPRVVRGARTYLRALQRSLGERV